MHTQVYKVMTKKEPIRRSYSDDGQVKKEGSLMVWWIPRVPSKSFFFPVANIREAGQIFTCLTFYDQLLLDDNSEPDYSNAGGVIFFDADGVWCNWCDAETGGTIDEAPIDFLVKAGYQEKV